MATGFFWDERCFWHGGGNYAFTLPVGGLVQPLAGGLPEGPETKRRLKNLIDVTGLASELDMRGGDPASMDDMLRVHSESYLRAFRKMSDEGGGELGLRAPFGPGGFEIAALSAGLANQAVRAVLSGEVRNAYALSRPPGHHCLPDFPNGFCLLANIAIAVDAAIATGLCDRVAVVDWDVHHGNGTEAIFYDRPDVLTVSIHQDRNYPVDSGDADSLGSGPGTGFNVNIPLPPGAGHLSYLGAMERIVVPVLRRFQPDLVVVACGYDAAAIDPLSRMLATAETFGRMTGQIVEAAATLCEGRVVMVHEGGYSEAYVPFCGHAALAALSGSGIVADDPLAQTLDARQPGPAFQAFLDGVVDDLALFHGTSGG